jgi:hypothetical protein
MQYHFAHDSKVIKPYAIYLHLLTDFINKSRGNTQEASPEPGPEPEFTGKLRASSPHTP